MKKPMCPLCVSRGWGGGAVGTTLMMLVFSVRGENFGFWSHQGSITIMDHWSHYGCSWQNAIICHVKKYEKIYIMF